MNSEFRRVKKANRGSAPALHPTLAALSVVLAKGADFAEIGRDYPKRRKHQFYDPQATFPEDITDLLPPQEERWWERLGK
jgi:hypothetical protein